MVKGLNKYWKMFNQVMRVRVSKLFALITSGVLFLSSLLVVIEHFEDKPSHDLTGQWSMNLKIEKTAYNPYLDMRIGYQLYLNQVGDSISGSGEKILENDEALPMSQRVKIDLKGRLLNESLDLLFTLHGQKRNTIGEFRLIAINDDELEGTFSTTGANASGSVKLYRTKLTQH